MIYIPNNNTPTPQYNAWINGEFVNIQTINKQNNTAARTTTIADEVV
jgi:hypothetical protein